MTHKASVPAQRPSPEPAGRYHRLVEHRFHCSIYYYVTGETVYVDAVLDGRRSPAWIRARLGRDK